MTTFDVVFHHQSLVDLTSFLVLLHFVKTDKRKSKIIL